MKPLMRNPALPAAATPATAASPSPATKYKSTSWQIMIVTMPATIGGAMLRMWLTMEPCVRSFISQIHFRRVAARTFVRQPRAKISFRGRDEFGHLPLEKAAIDAARPRRQRGMRALLDDPADVEHQDAIEAAHRRKPVRDHDRGAPLH